jgi:hypothetical protein
VVSLGPWNVESRKSTANTAGTATNPQPHGRRLISCDRILVYTGEEFDSNMLFAGS